jgi:hypothetical protein
MPHGADQNMIIYQCFALRMIRSSRDDGAIPAFYVSHAIVLAPAATSRRGIDENSDLRFNEMQ